MRTFLQILTLCGGLALIGLAVGALMRAREVPEYASAARLEVRFARELDVLSGIARDLDPQAFAFPEDEDPEDQEALDANIRQLRTMMEGIRARTRAVTAPELVYAAARCYQDGAATTSLAVTLIDRGQEADRWGIDPPPRNPRLGEAEVRRVFSRGLHLVEYRSKVCEKDGLAHGLVVIFDIDRLAPSS